MKAYDHTKIEKKWQKEWDTKKTYKTLSAKASKGKKPFYVLDMFPYPSGAGLHVGHPRGYIGSDVVARKMRMEGFNVLHPMGYDAFGLPAEQYAIQNNIHPRKAVEENVKTFERQLSVLGLSFDWSRKINTTDPAYYKWTQWIFEKIYESWYDTEKNTARPISDLEKIFVKSGNTTVQAATNCKTIFSVTEWKGMSEIEKQNTLMQYRLTYEGLSEVNWCPEMGTVLANDEIIDGPNGPVSERGGYPVEKKSMRQWFMRITAYADRLISGLDGLDWPLHIKEVQKNWIGKSEGSEIDFKVKGSDKKITVFTTRADTLFGVTYVVLAPEHPLVADFKNDFENKSEVDAYIVETKKKDGMLRGKEKTGVQLKGITAINPVNQQELPVWVADYALPNYGTGAVMAVPAHDERDFEFALKYKLPCRVVITLQKGLIEVGTLTEAYTGKGFLYNCGEFSNIFCDEAINKITQFVNGRIVTNYKLRDAVFARQRYWGEPIPLYTKDGVIHEVPEKKLPLELPNVKSYEPTGTGESPLAGVPAWVKGGYETNTMPGWAGSSWYFLRYADPKNKKAFADSKELNYWFDKKNHGGVNVYVGGAEHSTGHLLYSRFWHQFLFDLGLVPTKEPFQTLRNQGMILASDGRKMSKRWGNVINPDDIVKTYGADTLRLYEMFIGPFDSSLPWQTDSIIGPRRFIERVWRLTEKVINDKAKVTDEIAERAIHQCVKKVTEDIGAFGFNTAVSGMMICLNEMEKVSNISAVDFKKFLQLLAPFAPYVSEELWHELGEKKSIHQSGWPTFDSNKLVSDTVTIGVQVNSKVRDEITISLTASQAEVEKIALASPRVQSFLAGVTPKKVIYVPGRLLNFVV